jgi:hypothetical protein
MAKITETTDANLFRETFKNSGYEKAKHMKQNQRKNSCTANRQRLTLDQRIWLSLHPCINLPLFKNGEKFLCH